jgi:hypothetical protein
MNARTLVKFVVAVFILAILGGGYLIVASNAQSAEAGRETPSGFFH